jgi:predicted ATPase
VLDHDGSNLAAALQTILEIRSDEALATTLEDAFPGSRLSVQMQNGRLQQHGLLRSLSLAELSDGTRDIFHGCCSPQPTSALLNNPKVVGSESIETK